MGLRPSPDAFHCLVHCPGPASWRQPEQEPEPQTTSVPLMCALGVAMKDSSAQGAGVLSPVEESMTRSAMTRPASVVIKGASSVWCG